MADEKKDINEELLTKLVEEVHLLYHIEKEVASIKSDIGDVQSLRSEVEEMKKEKERMKKIMDVMKKAAVAVLFAALAGVVVLSFVSCDVLFPDLDGLFEDAAETGKIFVAGTSWSSSSADAPYIQLDFSSDGTTCTATDVYNIPLEGMVMGDIVVIGDVSYSMKVGEGTLEMTSGSISYLYKLRTT